MSPEEKATVAAALRILSKDNDALFAVHKAIEDEMVDLRDRGMMLGPSRNGMVIFDKDGTESAIIRMGTRMVSAMVMTELAKHLES